MSSLKKEATKKVSPASSRKESNKDPTTTTTTASNNSKRMISPSTHSHAVAFGRNYFSALGGISRMTLQHGPNQSITAYEWQAPPWCMDDDKNNKKNYNKENEIAQVVCSTQSTIFLTQGGHVYQTGTIHGHMYPSPTRIHITLPLKCEQVSAGRHFCLAKMEGGLATVSWGTGHFGQLGLGATPRGSGSGSGIGTDDDELDTQITFTPQPMIIERLLPHIIGSPMRMVAAGEWHALALTQAGRIWAWGSNRSFQCGRKPKTSSSSGGVNNNNAATTTTTTTTAPTLLIPLPVPLDEPATYIAAGRSHSLAIVNDQVYSWGSSLYGQCGNVIRRTGLAPPRRVEGLTDLTIATVSAAGNHTLALTSGGRIFAWGANAEGQLGLGPAGTAHSKPRLVADLDFVAIAAGREFLASQPCRDENVQQLSHVPRIVSIRAGATYSAAVSSSGHVYTWGSNDAGQLGLPTPPHMPFKDNSTQTPTRTSLARDLNVTTFDSRHNVLLPVRVEACRHLHVSMVACGPNHMWCIGSARPENDQQAIGRTLYEVQEERRQKSVGRARVNGDHADLVVADSDDYNEQLEASHLENNFSNDSLDTNQTPALSEFSSVNPTSPESNGVSRREASVRGTMERPSLDIGESETETTIDPDTPQHEPVSVTVLPPDEDHANRPKNASRRPNLLRRMSLQFKKRVTGKAGGEEEVIARKTRRRRDQRNSM